MKGFGHKPRQTRYKFNKGAYQKNPKPSRIWACRTLADTGRLARRMAGQDLPNVWLLHGTLGSGKTAFVRAVLRALKYRGPVTSPTFVLRHDFKLRHPRWKHVVHVDAYRVRGEHEESALDVVAAASDKNTLVLIEWPEKLKLLPKKNVLRINFTHKKVGRMIKVSRAI